MNIYVCNEYSELDFISNTYIYTCIIYNEYFFNGQFLQNNISSKLSSYKCIEDSCAE